MVNASFNGGTPKVKVNLLNSTSLIKASLISWDAGVPTIEFMFNPTELTFNCVVEIKDSEGARTKDKGQPKSSFSHVKPDKVTLSKILFDTYEDGDDVVEKYIDPFRAAVEFVGHHKSPSMLKGLPGPVQDLAAQQLDALPSPTAALSNLVSGKPLLSQDKKGERTPHYRFVWGSQVYMRRCAVESLTYKLTMFLPDGTPVRAIVDSLSLKAVDEDQPNTDLKKSVIDRVKDGLTNRISANASFKL